MWKKSRGTRKGIEASSLSSRSLQRKRHSVQQMSYVQNRADSFLKCNAVNILNEMCSGKVDLCVKDAARRLHVLLLVLVLLLVVVLLHIQIREIASLYFGKRVVTECMVWQRVRLRRGKTKPYIVMTIQLCVLSVNSRRGRGRVNINRRHWPPLRRLKRPGRKCKGVFLGVSRIESSQIISLASLLAPPSPVSAHYFRPTTLKEKVACCSHQRQTSIAF